MTPSTVLLKKTTTPTIFTHDELWNCRNKWPAVIQENTSTLERKGITYLMWSILISKEIVTSKSVSMSLWPWTLYRSARQFIKDKWFCLYRTMDNLICSDFFDSYYVISVTCDTYFINQSQNAIWLLFSMMMNKKPWVCTVISCILSLLLKVARVKGHLIRYFRLWLCLKAWLVRLYKF